MQRLNFLLTRLKPKWRRLSVAQQATLSITIPLLCLVTFLSLHLWLRQQAIIVRKSVDRSQMILIESHILLIEMLDAETAVRGYYVSRQRSFLQPYEHTLTALPATFDRLKQLVKNKPTQSERTKALEQLATQKLEILKTGIRQIESSTQGQTQVYPLKLPLVQGKAVMDQFRLLLEQLEAEEQQLLTTGQQNLRQRSDVILLAILVGIAISSLGAAVAIGLFRSLTQELRRRELRLQESHNLIRAVFANLVDGVVVLDAQKQIEGSNQAAEQMFGYTSQDLVGRNWTLLLAPETEVKANPLLSETKELQGNRPWQTMGQRQDGTCFPVEISISVIDFDDRHVVIIRDISERLQTAEKLQMRADEMIVLNTTLTATNMALSERNRELDQFAYVVSHDLKAPLRAIANLSAWIEEDLGGHLPAESQKHMELLRGRVYRMEALLDGLLDYARLGRTEIPVEVVDVAELLANVIKAVAPPTTFRVEIDSPMPMLRARRLLLQQVLMNLIENAVDHHPTKTGTVKVSVKDKGDRYKFAIADDGRGIDPRFYDRIYIIFQTLQARDIHESRGVGLAMVKKIVEMEGGKVHVESTVGKGSTFYFTWLKEPLNQINNPFIFTPIDRSV